MFHIFSFKVYVISTQILKIIYQHTVIPRVYRVRTQEVSQIRWFVLRIKIFRPHNSVDRNIRIVQNLQQIFEQYCIILKELKRKRSPSHDVTTKKRKTLKLLLLSIIFSFSFFAGALGN